MLESLTIKNYALIDFLDVYFSKGLNILSGETGAGKSILVGALGLLLGNKADSQAIRTGCEEAVISAVVSFDNTHPACLWLKTQNIDTEDGAIIIKRVIKRNGRSVITIQSEPVTMKDLQYLSSLIFDFHGQHEHQSLLRPDIQRSVLDSYGGYKDLLGLCSDLYESRLQLEKKLLEFQKSERELEREKDLLDYSIHEIEAAKLILGEDESIKKELLVLEQFEKIVSSLDEIRILFKGNGHVLDELHKALDVISKITRIDEVFEIQKKQIESTVYELEDVDDALRDYLQKVNYSPAKIDLLHERLQTINKMIKKYGNTIEEIFEYRRNAIEKLDAIQNRDEEYEKLKKELNSVTNKLYLVTQELSLKRKETAEELQSRLSTQLKPLGMSKAEFIIELLPYLDNENKPYVTMHGAESVEFLIAPNIGEPPKPLRKTASGGEISRVMLAAKTVLSESDTIDTLVFDEIDTGIGGAVATSVGDHIKKLSKHHQILCITHLAPIASKADCHFVVEKKIIDGKTFTTVTEVKDSDRVRELARMLAGDTESDIALAHAKELIIQ